MRLRKKKPRSNATGFLNLMPGNDLLSHGETPHYHRRSSVSLLSSGWDQVGPERYCCQANCFRERIVSDPFSMQKSQIPFPAEFDICNKK
jgi:hypothetical protein